MPDRVMVDPRPEPPRVVRCINCRRRLERTESGWEHDRKAHDLPSEERCQEPVPDTSR